MAPSLDLIAELTRRGARICAFDPIAMRQAEKVLESNSAVSLVPDMYQAVNGADALFVVTEWKMFRAPDMTRIKSLLKEPVVFDGRNLYNPAEMRKLGFKYQGIGR
jgi:UDPglucose 6-dehydrogenase